MTGTSPSRPAVPGAHAVDAVMVVHDGAPWLERALDAVADQTHPLRRLAVVLTGADDALPPGWDEGRGSIGALHLLEARGDSQPTAVASALDLLREDGALGRDGQDEWVWLLEDDCFPEPDCLETLLREATLSAKITVAGPKHVDATHPGRLVEVGRSVSRTGRRLSSPRHGELDQGQHDQRSDVLGVSTGAMLVRADALQTLGGLDPALPVGADLDLCWRAHLAGMRVVVVPAARVLDARASAQGLRSRERLPFLGLTLDQIDDQTFSHEHVMRERRAWERERRRAVARVMRRDRRAERAIALARCPLWQSPLLALRLLLGGLVLALVLLVLKRPRAALAELSDASVALAPWRWLGSLRRGGRGAVGGGIALGGLLAGHAQAMRGVRDEVYRGLPLVPTAVELEPSAEPGPVSDEALDLPGEDVGAQAARHPGVLAVLVALLVAAVGWWPVLRSGVGALRDRGLVGGELLASSGTAAGAWTRYLTGWAPGGLGEASAAPPWLPLVTGPAWLLEQLPGRAPTSSLGAATSLALVSAIPLAALSAYVSARVVTHRPWPRALAALAWAFSPALLVGVGEGRLGAAILGVSLPALAGALGASARLRPWWPSVGMAILAAAACAAVAPALLVVTTLAGAVIAVAQHGRGRLAGLLVILLPPLLLGPSVLRWWYEPVSMLTGPGLAQWSAPARPWLSAVLWPIEPAHGATTLPGPAWVGTALPLLMVPVLVAGVWGLGVSGRRGGAAGLLATVGLGALAVAVFAPRLTIAQSSGPGGTSQDITVWTGTPLLVLTLCLLAAALLGLDALARPGRGRGVRVLAAVVAGLVTCSVATQTIWLVAARLDDHLAVPTDRLPTVARDAATSSLAGRYLLLQPGDAVVRHRLQPGDPARLVRELPDAVPSPTLLAGAARSLVAGDDGAGTPVAERLAAMGVAFVGLDPADARISARLDTTAGLARLTEPGVVPVWRVTPRRASDDAVPVPVSRVRALDAKGAPLTVLPVVGPGPRVDADLPAGARTVAVAEPPAWVGTVTATVDGREVRGREAGGLSSYVLPEGARHLTIEPRPAHRVWSSAQCVAFLLTLALALPFGVRRRPGGEVVR